MIALAAAGVACAALAPRPLDAWGHAAHGMVQDRALALLPAGSLKKFMEAHEKTIQVRSRAIECPPRNAKEEFKHRIDLDADGYIPPIAISFEKVIQKLGEEKAVAHGRLPWAVVDAFEDAKRALRGHDAGDIEETLAVLGHLVADTMAPANVTIERDEKGDHAGLATLLQDRLVVANARAVQIGVNAPKPVIVVGRHAELIPDVLNFAWARVIESHTAWKWFHDADPGKKSKTREKDLWTTGENMLEQRLAESAFYIAEAWMPRLAPGGRAEPRRERLEGREAGHDRRPSARHGARRLSRGSRGTAAAASARDAARAPEAGRRVGRVRPGQRRRKARRPRLPRRRRPAGSHDRERRRRVLRGDGRDPRERRDRRPRRDERALAGRRCAPARRPRGGRHSRRVRSPGWAFRTPSSFASAADPFDSRAFAPAFRRAKRRGRLTGADSREESAVGKGDSVQPRYISSWPRSRSSPGAPRAPT